MQREMTPEDAVHIARLRAVRETGQFNMFTEVQHGLRSVFNDAGAQVTFDWVTDNFEYYQSGKWVDDDIECPECGMHLRRDGSCSGCQRWPGEDT